MIDVRTLFLSYVITKFLNNENVVVLCHLFKILILKGFFTNLKTIQNSWVNIPILVV